jgi:hypothetical protein
MFRGSAKWTSLHACGPYVSVKVSSGRFLGQRTWVAFAPLNAAAALAIVFLDYFEDLWPQDKHLLRVS